MDAHRVLLVAVMCLGVAGPVAQAQDRSVAESARARAPAKPWTQVRGFGRVLNLSNPPVVIDEPGLYAIDRNWLIPQSATAVFPELIQITADDVALDLHGFEIRADVGFAPPGPSTLLVIAGGSTEVRNGGLASVGDGGVAIRATRGPWLHHLSVLSFATMTFEGGATITDSDLGSRVEMRFLARARLERNSISCTHGARCIRLVGGSLFAGNEMSITQGGGIEVAGDGSTVANNVIDRTDDNDSNPAFHIKGDHNVVRDNTVLNGRTPGQPYWIISGTANTLEGNIAAAPAPGMRALTGMQFTADGNFYGNNRMAADVPFALGGTVQTDWGGNVGY